MTVLWGKKHVFHTIMQLKNVFSVDKWDGLLQSLLCWHSVQWPCDRKMRPNCLQWTYVLSEDGNCRENFQFNWGLVALERTSFIWQTNISLEESAPLFHAIISWQTVASSQPLKFLSSSSKPDVSFQDNPNIYV